MASSLNGTGLTFSSGATLNSPPVTSVATGNGLSGGTITTTGTISIAAPTQNTVGSYAFVFMNANNVNIPAFGTNYSAGTGANQITAAVMYNYGCGWMGFSNNQLSGTWKWMGATQSNVGGAPTTGIAVRVA